MQHYRVYYCEAHPDTTCVVRAATPEVAIRRVAGQSGDYDPDDVGRWVAEVYRPEMESECVCGKGRTFKNLEHPAYPGLWQCQNCGREFMLPPDQINWCWEAMFDEGYVPCICDRHDVGCTICEGLGWARVHEDTASALGWSSFLRVGKC
jgi:hypothetical protein